MSLPKKILAPTDFSELSAGGVRYAYQLARDVGAELLVLNVVLLDETNTINKNEIEKHKQRLDEFVSDKIADAASHGLQARTGGAVENNLFLNNPIGLSYGVVNGSGPLVAGGVTGAVRGNVFLGGNDIHNQPRGIGIEIANIKPIDGAVVEKNIFANSYAGGLFAAINLTTSNNHFNPEEAAGLNDLTIKDNVVYNWTRGLWVNPAMHNGGTGWRADVRNGCAWMPV